MRYQSQFDPGSPRVSSASPKRFCEPSKSARPASLQVTASPSIRQVVALMAFSASTISGKRSDQSLPLRVKSRTRSAPRRAKSREAIVLYLVNPVRAGRRSLDRARQARLDLSIRSRLSLPNTRFEHTDGATRQELDTQQCLRTARLNSSRAE